ncbi:GNAT family N-acetyltransferase [Croceiramulus getboli]|nr:GNAT family N-acetyltransferase [Flavobacteriaceae bacterium YJPT1-3]
MSVSIEAVQLSQLPLLAKVAKRAYEASYPYVWENGNTDFYLHKSFTVEAINQELNRSGVEYFLINHQEEPAGLLKIISPISHPRTAPTQGLELEKIYLLPEYTGLGIGKSILDLLVSRSRTEGLGFLKTEVMTTAKALPFYQKYGFQTIRTYHLDYPGLKEEHREMQEMLLLLK